MTSRQSARYGPMLFDASDLTTLKRRQAVARDLARQLNFYPGIFGPKRTQGPDYLSPSQVLSTGIASQYCAYLDSQYCPLPVIVSRTFAVGSYSPIPLPS